MLFLSVHDVEPSLPLLAGARALMGTHAAPQAAAAAAAAAATVTSLPPLQPRSATTGSTDLLFPLQVPCVCELQNFYIELYVILTPPLPYMSVMSVVNGDSLLRLQLAFICFHLPTHELSTIHLH